MSQSLPKQPEKQAHQSKMKMRRPSWASLPRMFTLAGYVLPKDVREQQFEPSFEDLYQDYLLWLRTHRGGFRRLWQNVLMALWTSKLFTECLTGMFKQKE